MRDRSEPVSRKDVLDRMQRWVSLGLSLASLIPALATAHSEGTEASDPSSPAAVLEVGVATRQYAALETGLKPWRTTTPVRAPMNHADHAAHAAPAQQMDHGQHAAGASPSSRMDHSQHTGQADQTGQVDHSQHAGPAMPVEVEVRKPAADAHQGH